MMHRHRPRVLIAGADQSTAWMLKLTLRDEGFDVVAVEGSPAVPTPIEEEIDILLVDLESWAPFGETQPPYLRHVGVPVVVLTGDHPRQVCRLVGADAAVGKPFDPSRLARVMRQLV